MVGRLIQASTPSPPRKVAASCEWGKDDRDVQREIPTHTHRHNDPPKQGSHPFGGSVFSIRSSRPWLADSLKQASKQKVQGSRAQRS